MDLDQLRGLISSDDSLITITAPVGMTKAVLLSKLDHKIKQASYKHNNVKKDKIREVINIIKQKVNRYQQLPPNGLIIFGGCFDGEFIIQTLELKQPCTKFLWLYDYQFRMDVIDSLLNGTNNYGVVVIDGNGVYFYTVKDLFNSGKESGLQIKYIDKYLPGMPGQHNKGGQSANRFQRLIRETRDNYITKVTTKMNQIYSPENNELQGVVIAGADDYIKKVINANTLNYNIKQQITDNIVLSKINDVSIQDVVLMCRGNK